MFHLSQLSFLTEEFNKTQIFLIKFIDNSIEYGNTSQLRIILSLKLNIKDKFLGHDS